MIYSKEFLKQLKNIFQCKTLDATRDYLKTKSSSFHPGCMLSDLSEKKVREELRMAGHINL